MSRFRCAWLLLIASTIPFGISAHLRTILDADNELQLSLARCIRQACEKSFETFEVITISLSMGVNETIFTRSTTIDVILLPELFNRYKWTLLVKQPSRGRPSMFTGVTSLTSAKSDSYIIQLRSWNDIDIHLNYLKRHPSWNPHAKFIIISVPFDDDGEGMLQFIVRKLWKRDILNGVILTANKKDPNTFNIHSWFPFANGSCGNHFSKMVHLDACSNGLMRRYADWFPNKLPPKMNNCSVHIRTLDYPPYIVHPLKVDSSNSTYYHVRKGLEAQLLNMIASVSNLYMRYEIKDNDTWGEFAKHASLSNGLVGALVRAEADIAVASLSATYDRHSRLDSTSAYFQDSVGFCVPHAEEISQWEKLSGIMALNIWISVAFTMLIMAIITKALSHPYINPGERGAYMNPGSVMQKVLAISIGQAINVLPRSTQVRLFLMTWIVFGLHLDTGYQTYLMSALTSVEYTNQIKSVDDILASDLELLFRPSDKKYFEDSATTKQAEQIVARWKDCNDLDACLRRTAYKRDSVIAASRLYIQYARSSYLSKTGLPLLYCIQEQIVTFPVVAYMRHGFPLQHKFDEIISRMNSGGFIQRFEEELFQEKKFAGDFKNESYQEDDFLDVDVKNKLLTFGHIQPIFMMLFAGYIASSFALFMEILCRKYRHKVRYCIRKQKTTSMFQISELGIEVI